MKENNYQRYLKKKLKEQFPQCEIRKLDSNDIQGSPDILILCPLTWATLEVKQNKKSNVQPNQEFYINKHDNMSFSSFIYPENENEVFYKLKKHINNFSKGEQRNDI